MFRGVYSAATGMLTASRSQEVTAHNLAHGTMHGFRQHGVVNETFESAFLRAEGVDRPLIGARVAREFTDFRPGPLQETASPLDLAIQGEGFFTVAAPGGPAYTRDGVLQRSADGQLLNTAGYPLLGTRGPIRIPPQARDLVVAADGSVIADGVPVDRLQLVRFRDPTQLEPVGTALFRATPEAGQSPGPVSVAQGYREGSNVQFASAMVALITELRYFEASQRALRTISDSVAQVTRAA